MGGYKGGEVASAMAVSLLHASFGRWFAQAGMQAPSRVVRRALQAATDEANGSILHASTTNPELQGMGTTLVLAAFRQQRVVVGHIGDSRCYRLRNNKLELLTRDHSLRQQQLDAGAITPEEAANSPTRNLVTRAVGVEPQVMLEMHEHSARAGDLYMLCSDGLSEMISDEQLFTLLEHDAELQKKLHFWLQLQTTMAAVTIFRLFWLEPASRRHPARPDSTSGRQGAAPFAFVQALHSESRQCRR